MTPHTQKRNRKKRKIPNLCFFLLDSFVLVLRTKTKESRCPPGAPPGREEATTVFLRPRMYPLIHSCTPVSLPHTPVYLHSKPSQNPVFLSLSSPTPVVLPIYIYIHIYIYISIYIYIYLYLYPSP
jgi:hypothetical protein